MSESKDSSADTSAAPGAEVDRRSNWPVPPRPKWLAALNREGEHLDLKSVVPLDQDSLIESARRATGLADFGKDHWREPFACLCRDIDGPAQLTPVSYTHLTLPTICSV